MKKQNYTVEILVNGRPVKEYAHGGETYVEGRKGTPYKIKIRNHSSRRIKAVITVDGNSVLTDAENFESGYIVNGYGTLTVNGFRTSDHTEAEFIFNSKGESRAQKVKGNASNCGVIGVRVFQEEILFRNPIQTERRIQWPAIPPRPQPYWLGSVETYCSVSNTGVNSLSQSCSVNYDLGTEMGEDIVSDVEYVEFRTAENQTPCEFLIYYASKKALKRAGVQLESKTYATKKPQAFGGYCKRPRK